MTYVLVHGGGFAGSCWDPLLEHLDAPAVAVDLPGRGSRPADLTALSIGDFADAVVEAIGDRDDVVLVGHSLAGVTLPQVLGRIPDRIRHAVFVSCSVPEQGTAVFEILATFGPVAAEVVEHIGDAALTDDGRLHADLATAMFCTEMTDAQRTYTIGRMVPEAIGPVFEPVDLSGLREDIPRTYVRLLRDASLDLATQDRMIANLGDVDVVDLDAGHMAMISHPAELAAVLQRIAGA